MSGWHLRVRPFTLELKHRFTIATSSRTTTPTVLVELERDGIVGHGEASMPPYLGETQESARTFLEALDLASFEDPYDVEGIVNAVDRTAAGNCAAKAAFDIALHDWIGRAKGEPCYRMFGIDPDAAPITSFTIGIDRPEVVREMAAKAAVDFASLKIKLGGAQDRAMIEAIREAAETPIRVDVNQGWRDRDAALVEVEWLASRGVEFVEQPMPKGQVDDLVWLRERSPLPIVGDEGVQRLADVEAARGVYDGINIKLMKCTGLHEARQMVERARALDLKIMLGCMTETSCAISAAAQIAPLVDWADLDGALLIANDPFEGARLVEGRIVPLDRPGIGIAPRE